MLAIRRSDEGLTLETSAFELFTVVDLLYQHSWWYLTTSDKQSSLFKSSIPETEISGDLVFVQSCLPTPVQNTRVQLIEVLNTCLHPVF